ncbi:hypothetical protein A2U01_0108686, partial [Trifolium medium]|nr:hypothetical protein [Trifolium medium]
MRAGASMGRAQTECLDLVSWLLAQATTERTNVRMSHVHIVINGCWTSH